MNKLKGVSQLLPLHQATCVVSHCLAHCLDGIILDTIPLMPKDDPPKKPHRKTVPGVFVLRDNSSTSRQHSKVYRSIETLRQEQLEPPSPPSSATPAPQFLHIIDRSPTPELHAGPSAKPHPEPYFLPTDIFDVEASALGSTTTPPNEVAQQTASNVALTCEDAPSDSELDEMAGVDLDSAGIEAQLVRRAQSMTTKLYVRVLIITTQFLPLEFVRKCAH